MHDVMGSFQYLFKPQYLTLAALSYLNILRDLCPIALKFGMCFGGTFFARFDTQALLHVYKITKWVAGG